MKSFRQLWVRLVLFALLGIMLSNCGGSPYYKSYGYHPPPQDGVYHHVQKGQTLYSIAKAYGMTAAELQRINGIWEPEMMEVGMHLWIPGAKRVVYVPPTVEGAPGVARTPAPEKKKRVQKKKSTTAKARLAWPVKGGVLTSRFGTRNGKNHHGIDIGARKGTPILAADKGTVEFSGWGPRGYGLIVIIKHPGNLTTVYAHNSRNMVKKGNKVKRGQVIARVGKTGRATGPHLHFEVRNDTHPKNPLPYFKK